MKKIEEHFSMKYAQAFVSIFTTVFIVFYFLIRGLINEVDLLTYNIVFISMFLLLSVMLGVGYFFLKTREREMLHDIREIDKYVHEIAQNKNYKAIVKIEHYIDLLKITVSLKNMVKRLEKKDRKFSKK